jgi:sulfate/thiosulfate transport system ATP-binding protein
MSVSVTVRNLEKTFDQFSALRGISLEVNAGELVALLGPSGSGKTTLLRCIAGLEHQNSGSVFFGDINADQLTLRERRIGFVFQHYALFKHMKVADNIAFGLRARPHATRPTEQSIRAKVEELLNLVQLEGLEMRYPSQLSGGQRQRVALARALAIEPRVLLLDEPFGALDAKVRKDLRRWLKALHLRTGHTTLFVTHDQDEAFELADRVAILNQGIIEQIDTPPQILNKPRTKFIAEFVDGIGLKSAIAEVSRSNVVPLKLGSRPQR